MTSKEEYIEFCKDNESVRLFCQPWWLDAVCGEENWDVLLVNENGNILGAWPYQLKKKYGFRYILSPAFTQITGPIITYPDGQSIIKKQSYANKVLDKLIEQLPAYDWLQLDLDYDITNWQPFYWKDFNQ
ncbi:MAG TPA: hypothetical protein VE912_06470, partial [Bacteroidales bacterium]|nr:hypothetical protein [Bacteroidales bacterium]